MRSEDAISELCERFTGGNHYDIQDVTGFFSSLPREDVGTVFQCIVRNHEYNTFPKLVKIKKYMAETGIQFTEKERKEKAFEYYVCQVCKAKFDTEIGWCPVCKKHTDVKVYLSRQKVDGAFEGRQGCAKCEDYNSRNICTSCDNYGNPGSMEMCRDCQGLACCTEYRDIRNKRGA